MRHVPYMVEFETCYKAKASLQYWKDEGKRTGARLENPAKSETVKYLAVVVEYWIFDIRSDIRQPKLSGSMLRTWRGSPVLRRFDSHRPSPFRPFKYSRMNEPDIRWDCHNSWAGTILLLLLVTRRMTAWSKFASNVCACKNETSDDVTLLSV